MLIFHESKNAIHADVKDDGTMIPAVIQDLDANLRREETSAKFSYHKVTPEGK